ncbi:GNAT family N-acetyltransferase [Candidatus Epulonipiscium viviparus]|uniref:GNAT family N-acetyltransferase n=1 Tax=Candidatus Epulonipiscium viviparus TaxID=420336 RepID=UPI00016C0F37|nr:GNAT family N-acetyltransferase [Candidatus Epulopiscium viviparus]
MIKLQRIVKQDNNYDQGYSLYLENFPPEQSRAPATQKFVLNDEKYHYDIILVDDVFSGIIMYWEYDEYIYIEHFAICKDKRGAGLGTQTLALIQNKGKLVILEIDPPIDAYAKSRQKFYERSGFVLTKFEHNPPAYRFGLPNQNLVIMASGPLTDTLYQTYYQQVCINIVNPLISTQEL